MSRTFEAARRGDSQNRQSQALHTSKYIWDEMLGINIVSKIVRTPNGKEIVKSCIRTLKLHCDTVKQTEFQPLKKLSKRHSVLQSSDSNKYTYRVEVPAQTGVTNVETLVY